MFRSYETEFFNILLSTLINNEIDSFNLKELRRDLNYYFKDNNFNTSFYDLDKYLYMQQIIGKIYMMNNEVYIRDFSYYDKVIDMEKYKDIKQFCNEYKLKNSLQNKYKIKIYKTDPNQRYSLIKGLLNGKELSFNIITDGDIDLCKYEIISDDLVSYYDVIDNDRIKLNSDLTARCDVVNSKYTIIEKCYDNKVCSSVLFTSSIKPNDVKDIINFKNKKKIKHITL